MKTLPVLTAWMLLSGLLTAHLGAQPDTTLGAPQRVVSVPEGTSLAVDQEGNLFVLSPESNRLCKLLARFYYDSTYCMGGPGVTGEAFNRPTMVQVRNRQEVFVLDPNNRRLVLLNVDLRWLRELDFEENPLRTPEPEPLRYLTPISFALGGSGELYLLSSEDNAVYKYDQFGRYERRFGGLDYAEGQLIRPSEVVVTGEGLVVVADSASQVLTVFDTFGEYQYRLAPRLPFRWRAVRVIGAHLLFVGPRELAVYAIDLQRAWVLRLPAGGLIRDARWLGGGLYVLQAGAVSLYRFPLSAR